ncbi:hypothetical protein OAK15_05005 [Verrucomicrobia bacterium]|nr:hypothetical protein [Verrucomicrobiota bacterium]
MKWYTKVAMMLSSIVFCTALSLVIMTVLDHDRGAAMPTIYAAMGASLGIIVGIKLIK